MNNEIFWASWLSKPDFQGALANQAERFGNTGLIVEKSSTGTLFIVSIENVGIAEFDTCSKAGSMLPSSIVALSMILGITSRHPGRVIATYGNGTPLQTQTQFADAIKRSAAGLEQLTVRQLLTGTGLLTLQEARNQVTNLCSRTFNNTSFFPKRLSTEFC